MLDVGEQELLMLLLVMKSERDRVVLIEVLEKLEHVLVDITAILEYLLDGRSSHETALRTTVSLASLNVVRVEEVRVPRIERHIMRIPLPQNERLEKPARVSQVPLRRTYVGHGAHDVILDLQRLAQFFSVRANRTVLLAE